MHTMKAWVRVVLIAAFLTVIGFGFYFMFTENPWLLAITLIVLCLLSLGCTLFEVKMDIERLDEDYRGGRK